MSVLLAVSPAGQTDDLAADMANAHAGRTTLAASTGFQAPSVTVLGGQQALPAAVTEQLDACATGGSGRVSGADRFATAVALSERAFPDGAAEVVVASGVGFADALAAGPVAARLDAPLLLAHAGGVPDVTLAEVRRLAPEQVTLVGGPRVLSEDVAETLRRVAPVSRIAGDDRFATAALLAVPETHTAYVATGTNWPDALAAGPAAAVEDASILLVTRDTIPDATREGLARVAPERIIVAGGPAVVSDAVIDALASLTGAEVTRVAGPDRFATAAALADHAFAQASAVVVATGHAPADALAAVPIAARSDAPLLLAGGSALPARTIDVLARLGALDCRAVELEAGATERLALGGGVRLTVAGPTGTVSIGRIPSRLLLPGAASLKASYPAPEVGGPAVAWDQQVGASEERVVVEQPWRGTRPAAPGGITLAWHANNTWAGYAREVANAPGLTVSSPVSMHLDASGNLRGGVDAGFVADAQSRGVAVWPAIASLNADHIRAAVADPDRRAALASAVSEHARRAGADGVNIDLEGWTHDTTDAVTDFVRRLTAAVHGWGGVTSIDLVSMTDSWATPPEEQFSHWSTAPQRRELSEAVDYVVLMAYDEHNRLRPAGPVASPGWVEQAVRYQLRFTDPDRLILGVPLYGRVWEPGRLDQPRAVPIGQIASLARQGRRSPDPVHGVDRVDLPDGRFTWAEDHAGLAHRTGLVNDLGLAGTASWRLGFDDPAVWPVLAGR